MTNLPNWCLLNSMASCILMAVLAVVVRCAHSLSAQTTRIHACRHSCYSHVNMRISDEAKLAKVKAALELLEDAGVRAAVLDPLRREYAILLTTQTPAPSDTPAPASPRQPPPPPPNPLVSAMASVVGAWERGIAAQRERADTLRRQQMASNTARAEAEAVEAAASARAAEALARLPPRERARRELARAVDEGSIRELERALEAAEAAGLSGPMLRTARNRLVRERAAEDLEPALRRLKARKGMAEAMALKTVVEAAAAAGVRGESMREACELLARRRLPVSVPQEVTAPSAAPRPATSAARAASTEAAARTAKRPATAPTGSVAQREQAEAAKAREAGARARQAQAEAAAARTAAQAEARDAARAEAAAASWEAARATAASAALDKADKQLQADLRAAIAQLTGGGGISAQSSDALRLKALEVSLQAAEAAGVTVGDVVSARAKLAELEALAAVRVAQVQLAMAVRRAQAGGDAEMIMLSRQLGSANRAGVDGDALRAARELLGKRGTDVERQTMRLLARLEKFEKLAERGEGGEAVTAAAMASQARAQLEGMGYDV